MVMIVKVHTDAGSMETTAFDSIPVVQVSFDQARFSLILEFAVALCNDSINILINTENCTIT